MLILFVDDKSENLDLLETIFTPSGYLPIFALNGAEALDLARENTPDIIVSDILMPVMDGYNLCREIKKDTILCKIPFIFYTATYTDPKDEEFALSLGADRYLIKPLHPNDLITIVEEVLKETKNKKNRKKEASLNTEMVILKEYNEELVLKLEDEILLAEQSGKELKEKNILLNKKIEEQKQAEEATIRVLEALHESEERFRLLFENSLDAVLTISQDNKILSANPAAHKMFGWTEEELKRSDLYRVIDISDPRLSDELRERIKTNNFMGELIAMHKDGTEFPVELSSSLLQDRNGKIRTSMIIRNITKRKLAEKSQVLISKILLILSRHNEWQNLIKDILHEIKDFSGLEAIGIRLKVGEDYPYIETIGFPDHFVKTARFLCLKNMNGEILRDSDNKPILECMCGSVISGRTNATLPFFTKYGSFWSNSSAEFFTSASETNQQIKTRNQCNDEGYQSIALIPLKSDNEIIGLLQLNDKQKNRFTPETIQFLEELSSTIGIAIKKMLTAKEIKESEEKFAVAFQTSPNAITITHAENGQFIDVNNTFCSLTGFTRKEALSDSSIGLQLWVNEDDRQNVIDTLLKGKTVESTEYQFRIKSGNVITGLFSAKMIKLNQELCILASIYDISKKKESEEALKESETRFRQFIETAVEGVCSVDINENMTFVNQRFSEMLGYQQKEIIEQNIESFMFPEDLEDQHLMMGKRKQGVSDIYERRFMRKDGTTMWTLVSASPILDNSGSYIGSFGMLTDITDRKDADNILRESEEKFRSLTQSANEAIITADSNGIITEWNRGARNIFGYSEAEIIGKDLKTLIPHNYVELHTEGIKRLELGGESHLLDKTVEFRGIRKNGNEFPLELSLAQWETSTGKYYTGIIRDITRRKKIEKEVRLLAHSMESITECVSITDIEDIIVFINDSFCEMYQYSKEELIGKHIGMVRPDNIARESVVDILPKTIEGGWKGEVVNRKKDGTLFPVYLSTSVVKDKFQKPIALIGVAIDITELRNSREQLIMAKEKAEQADNLKSEFLSQMSHEIRTPFNVILGNIEYLNDSLNDKLDDDMRDSFESVYLASKRIMRTIDLVLNMSEILTAKYQLQLKEIDLNSDILLKLIQEHLLTAKKKGVNLIYTCKEKHPKILADEYSVMQIFANLLDNAIKYTIKGKVEVILKANDTGNYIVIVKDTGIGISKEFLPSIFESFSQEDHGYSRLFEGNGLGLALVKKYCDINNAVLEVESTKNAGTTFKIIFPKN